MPQTYSARLREFLEDTTVYRLGKDLGAVCVKANLPASYVAVVLDVSRITIHSWFRGGTIRPRKREKVETFIKLVEEDMEKGLLPAKSLRDAKAYLGDMIGRPITLKKSD
jgi:hypothetical protein